MTNERVPIEWQFYKYEAEKYAIAKNKDLKKQIAQLKIV